MAFKLSAYLMGLCSLGGLVAPMLPLSASVCHGNDQLCGADTGICPCVGQVPLSRADVSPLCHGIFSQCMCKIVDLSKLAVPLKGMPRSLWTAESV